MNISEQFVSNYIDKYGPLPAFDQAISDVIEYTCKEHFEAKSARLAKWLETEPDIKHLVLSVYTITLLNKTLTYQAICGILHSKLKGLILVHQVKTIAEVIAVISYSGLINITRRGAGRQTLISTGYTLDEDIPVEDKHELQFRKPQKVVSNYDPIQGSMLLGGSLNHHNDDICLDHINRVNSVPLSINIPFLKTVAELPTFELDTIEKQQQWAKFKKDSMYKYLTVARKKNKIFMQNKYDTRGRTYACGYHITTQGTSFKKAMIELYNKELVTDEIT